MTHIFLALGSNVGERKKNIETAITLLSQRVSNIKKASFYETRPVGYVEQDNFINTALEGDTDLNPGDLLGFVKRIEKKIGRIQRFKWGPREIDIDILFYGNILYNKNDLTIPHPRLYERDFVLQPLSDLNPDFIHPGLNKSIKQLRIHLKNKSIIKKLKKLS